MDRKERDLIAQKIGDFIQAQTRDLSDDDCLDVLDNVDDRVSAMIAAKSDELASGDDDDDDDDEDAEDSDAEVERNSLDGY